MGQPTCNCYRSVVVPDGAQVNHGEYNFMVPIGKNGKAFSSQGILLKILEKIRKKLYWKTEKNTGKVMEICQPVIVKTLQIWYHTLDNKKAKGLMAQLSTR